MLNKKLICNIFLKKLTKIMKDYYKFNLSIVKKKTNKYLFVKK